MERNFLMSVSHELRTPLTAIRGHVSASARGRRRRSGAAAGVARDGRGRGAAARAARRRHPRPRQARHAPLHGDDARRSTWRSSSTRRTRRYRDEARRRAIDYRREGARPAGDHLGRRPRAAGRRQPALERVPRDARRRPDLARARAAERHGARRGRGHRPRDPGREARAALPAVRLASSAAAPASGSRSRRSCRPRSAAGSSSTPRSATARGSSSCCPRTRVSRRLPRQRHDVRPRRAALGRLEQGLDPVEPRVQRAPAFGEQLDEEREVVDAGVALGTRASPRCARAGGSHCSRGP